MAAETDYNTNLMIVTALSRWAIFTIRSFHRIFKTISSLSWTRDCWDWLRCRLVFCRRIIFHPTYTRTRAQNSLNTFGTHHIMCNCCSVYGIFGISFASLKTQVPHVPHSIGMLSFDRQISFPRLLWAQRLNRTLSSDDNVLFFFHCAPLFPFRYAKVRSFHIFVLFYFISILSYYFTEEKKPYFVAGNSHIVSGLGLVTCRLYFAIRKIEESNRSAVNLCVLVPMAAEQRCCDWGVENAISY